MSDGGARGSVGRTAETRGGLEKEGREVCLNIDVCVCVCVCARTHTSVPPEGPRSHTHASMQRGMPSTKISAPLVLINR